MRCIKYHIEMKWMFRKLLFGLMLSKVRIADWEDWRVSAVVENSSGHSL